MNIKLHDRTLIFFDILIIISIAFLPLFLTYPYRVNLFLSWEGAYRMSQGQMPYRDFGMPLGYGYWLIPALFFKLLGPQLFTLVKAQVLINLISGFAFRTILKQFKFSAQVVSISLLVYCISFSFFNFWPWYNHTVIVYQFVGLAFLSIFLLKNEGKLRYLYLLLAAVFLFLSLFTKQDGGALGILIALSLVLANGIWQKKWVDSLLFIVLMFVVGLAFIMPLSHSFSYWFNYGQAPHISRLSIFDLVDENLTNSTWIKFYLAVLVLIGIHRWKKRKTNPIDRAEFLFALLTLGILVEAAIFQVTSYVPADNNIFFHSFFIAFILNYLVQHTSFEFKKPGTFVLTCLLVLLWWSGTYWRYVDRVFSRFDTAKVTTSKENVVNRHNYALNTDTATLVPLSDWKFSGWKDFDRVKLPPSTIVGMNRIKAMPQFASGSNSKVLNMTELTPLAHELGFSLEKGEAYPLWFHLGVGMFNKQLEMFDQRVQQNYYDVILYEYIPSLNNFYPFELRKQLQEHYRKADTFLAPRNPTNAIIEVYVKK